MSVHTDPDVFNGAVIHCRAALNRLRGLIEFVALRLMRTSAEMLRNFAFREALIEFCLFFFFLYFYIDSVEYYEAGYFQWSDYSLSL